MATLVCELDTLATLVNPASVVSSRVQVRMALCTREGQERFTSIWHEIDMGASLDAIVADVLYVVRERLRAERDRLEAEAAAARTVTEYRFRPCGFGEATHYRHVRENAIFPMDEYHARHSGDCVLPLAVELVEVAA